MAIINSVELGNLATQIATDWYLWQLGFLDVKLNGSIPWTPEGFDEIEWTYHGAAVDNGPEEVIRAEASTRIMKVENDDFTVTMAQSSPTASSILLYFTQNVYITNLSLYSLTVTYLTTNILNITNKPTALPPTTVGLPQPVTKPPTLPVQILPPIINRPPIVVGPLPIFIAPPPIIICCPPLQPPFQQPIRRIVMPEPLPMPIPNNNQVVPLQNPIPGPGGVPLFNPIMRRTFPTRVPPGQPPTPPIIDLVSPLNRPTPNNPALTPPQQTDKLYVTNLWTDTNIVKNLIVPVPSGPFTQVITGAPQPVVKPGPFPVAVTPPTSTGPQPNPIMFAKPPPFNQAIISGPGGTPSSQLIQKNVNPQLLKFFIPPVSNVPAPPFRFPIAIPTPNLNLALPQPPQFNAFLVPILKTNTQYITWVYITTAYTTNQNVNVLIIANLPNALGPLVIGIPQQILKPPAPKLIQNPPAQILVGIAGPVFGAPVAQPIYKNPFSTQPVVQKNPYVLPAQNPIVAGIGINVSQNKQGQLTISNLGNGLSVNGSQIKTGLVSTPTFQLNLSNSQPAAPVGAFTNVTWQTDTNGNISGYVPTSSGGSTVPTFPKQFGVNAFGTAAGATVTSTWGCASTNQGTTISATVNARGSWATFATASGNNGIALSLNTSGTSVGIALGPGGVFLANVEFPNSTDFGSGNSVRFFAGLTASAILGSDTPVTSAVGFFMRTTDNTFQCYTGNGTTSTFTASGVTVAANTTYLLKVDFTNTGSIVFSINGTVVATVTATLPSNTTQMFVQVENNATIATTRNLHIGVIWCGLSN